jgi:Uma2 family endonuclease
MAVELARRRFTVDEYHRMGEVGILTRDDRVELIDGEIVEMTPIGPRHAFRVATLDRRFQTLLGDRAVVWVQMPVRLGPHHEPEPDLALLRPPLGRYANQLPGPEDVLLLVEVSETSLAYDRGVKLGMYAGAGVPEVWIMDLEGEAIEVYRTPTPTGYREHQRVTRGGRVAPDAFPDVPLPIDDVLG